MIRNLIFDVGNVLVEYDPDGYMRRLGFDETVRAAVNEAMFQNPLWNESDRGALSSEELLAGFIANRPEYEADIRKAWDQVGDTIALKPDMLAWLEELKKKGYRLYVLSNYAAKTYEQTVHKLKFLPLMDGALFSFQCKLIKPEPQIYQHLCRTYQLVPSECVFFDDRQENVEAARAFGMQAVRFTGYDSAVRGLELSR